MGSTAFFLRKKLHMEDLNNFIILCSACLLNLFFLFEKSNLFLPED